MSYTKQLTDEIRGVLIRLSESQKDWKADMITTEVVSNHEHELKRNAHFSRHNNWENTRREVNRVMKKMAGIEPEETSNQLVLDGFERLQQNYMVTRDGERIGVHIYNMTVTELIDKKNELRAMRRGLEIHEDEIDRFISQQFPESIAS
jgi:hypothetical protein